MRRTRRSLAVLLLPGLLGWFAVALTRGQDPASPPPQPVVPVAASVPAVDPSHTADPARLSGLPRQMALGAQRATTWLTRMNTINGRFRYGWIPALNTTLEGDHFLRQAGAAMALARGARLTGEERAAARATQAILSLLDETTVDPQDPHVRYTTLPSIVVNRLGAAGLIVLAINELPAPQKDLLDRSEQLCGYIRRQVRPDGSLSYSDSLADGRPGPSEPDGISFYPGEALYALMVSHRHRPAEWKLDVVRKAVACYHPWWVKNPSMAFIPWQTAAYTEAFLLTREPAFARCVLEMNDWLLNLQYTRLDPRHPLWRGGFMTWSEGRALEAPPGIASASCAESLAQAWRVAKEMGDQERAARYRGALEMCLQMLSTLQLNDSNTQHFKDGYRTMLVGAFHASHQDGTLRIDYTQHALCALLLYLEHVAR